MQILGTDAYRTALSEAISQSQNSVILVSAYLTIEGLEWILERLSSDVKCKVLTRWNCSDIVAGASDLEVYEKLKMRDYKLYVLPDIHAKVIVVDKKQIFLGSANITNSGLRLVPGGNREIGTVLTPNEQDLAFIEVLFDEAIWVNQDIYEVFYSEFKKLKDSREKPAPQPKWSSELLEKLRKSPQHIWVTETLWCNSPKDLIQNPDMTRSEVIHDLALLGLGISEGIDEILLRESFLNSRIWQWLKHKLQLADNQEMYYGKLSAELHNSFLDDPKPYRKNVKGLLTNLLNWSTALCGNLILVDKPNYSQRIRFVRD